MPVHAFYLLSRQRKPCGEHTSQVCVPHGGAVEITAGPSSEAEGPCRKRREKRVNVFYFIRLLVSSGSVPEAIQELFQAAGIVAAAFVLLLGFIFFLPTIISGLRKTKSRRLICVANVIFIVVAFFNIILPLVIWLGLMILAVTGKKDAEKIETTGIKITHSYREDG